MSREISGDITCITEGIIVHQVNCMNAMGAGVALALMTKWPEVYYEYIKHNINKQPSELFGDLHEVIINDKLSIMNSYSQLAFGGDAKHTHDETLITNIKKAAQTASKRGLNVYIPDHIGCGLGGGDWSVIYNGIKDIDNLVIVKYMPY